MAVGLNDGAPLATQAKIVDPTSSAYAAQVYSDGKLAVSGSFTAGSISISGSASVNITQIAGVNVSTSGPAGALAVSVVTSSGSVLDYSQPVGISTAFMPTKTLATAILSSATFTGLNTIVASVSGQTTRIYRLFFTVGTASQISFFNGSASLSGQMNLAASGGMVLDLSSEPWFITSSNQSFGISATVTTALNGRVEYITS